MTDDVYAAYTADDAILLNLVRTGEAEAYEVLRQRHEQAAHRMARCLVRAEDVDDLVAETFARLLDTTLRGGGPTDAFRPYLLTALRRVSYESRAGQYAEVPADSGEAPDPGELFIDPGMADLATSVIVRAFRSLSDRWIAVLWHTVIEETSPPEITQILGLSRNEVAALKRRARKGLRQAYLRLLISDVARPECQPVARQLADIVRDTASSQDRAMVTEHLGHCSECRAAYTDLADLNIALRSQAGRVFLGSAAGSYLPRVEDSAASTAAAEPASEQTGPQAAALGARGSRHISRPLLLTAAGTVPLAGIAAALAVTLTGQGSPPLIRSGQPVQAAAQPTEPPAHKPQGKGATPIPSAASRPARSPGAPRAASSPSAHPTARGPRPSSPAPSGTPAPAPTSTLPASLTMAASLNTAQSGTDQLSFGITNSGGTTTGDVSVSVSLPAGTSWSGPGAVSSGWTCQSTSFGVTCQAGPLAANTQAHASLVIDVWDLGEACGERAYLTAASGSVSAWAQTGDGVQCRWG